MAAAWNQRDLATVERLIADDFHGVAHNGRELEKPDMLRAVAANQEGATEVSEERIVDLGDTVIYTALVAARTARTRVSDIWVKRSSRWLLLSSQVTPVNP